MSLTASQVGAAIWKARADSELLFKELMLMGVDASASGASAALAAATDLLGLSAGRPKASHRWPAERRGEDPSC